MAKEDKRGVMTKAVNWFGWTTRKQLIDTIDDMAKELRDLQEEVAYVSQDTRTQQWNWDDKKLSEEDFMEAATHTAWFYAAVFMISSTVAQLPFQFTIAGEADDGTEERVELNQKRHITKLFDYPDPLNKKSWYDTIEATVWYLETAGNAYWLLQKGDYAIDGTESKKARSRRRKKEADTDVMFRIRVLRPDKMHPVRNSKTGALEGWKYKPRGDEKSAQDFDTTEIVHFCYFNPIDDFQGLSPANPAWDSIETSRQLARMNRKIVENNYELGLYLKADADAQLTATMAKDILRKLKARHQGVNKAGEPFYAGPGISVEQVAQTKDMQFETLHKIAIQNIAAATGVPAALLGMDGTYNRANLRAIRSQFYQDTIMPKVARIQNKIQMHVLPVIEGTETVEEEGLEFAFDFSGVEALKEEPDKVARATQLSTGRPWKTVNEAREDMGMAISEDPSADELYVKSSPAGIGGGAGAQIGENTQETGAQGAEEAGTDTNGDEPKWRTLLEYFEPLERVDKVRAKADPKGFERWKKMIRATKTIERRMITAIHNGARKERDKVLEVLEKEWHIREESGIIQKSNCSIYGILRKQDPLMPRHEFETMLNEITKELQGQGDWMVEALMPEVESAIIKGAGLSAGDLVTGFEFDLMNPEVQKYIDQIGTRITTEIPNTTLDKFQQSMWNGWEHGESITKLADRVKEQLGYLGGYNDYRAELIARTETISAFNRGSLDSYRQEKIDGVKIWISAFDDRVRDWHIDIEDVQGTENYFTVYSPNGPVSMLCPGDQAGGGENCCNCRCALGMSPATDINITEEVEDFYE